MRALCKKGDHCEFLHEYNLRRMPECNSFARHRTCPNGDDCMYQHLEPIAKRTPCPHYERGFCPLGPLCSQRHVKRTQICPFYMSGFCPYGFECEHGAHARFPTDLPKPTVKGPEPEADVDMKDVGAQDQNYEGDGGQDQSFGGAGQQKFGRGNWQNKKKRGGSGGGGGPSYRGRRN
jgi:cleavage and polyadenylation specificity factor subunit 4